MRKASGALSKTLLDEAKAFLYLSDGKVSLSSLDAVQKNTKGLIANSVHHSSKVSESLSDVFFAAFTAALYFDNTFGFTSTANIAGFALDMTDLTSCGLLIASSLLNKKSEVNSPALFLFVNFLRIFALTQLAVTVGLGIAGFIVASPVLLPVATIGLTLSLYATTLGLDGVLLISDHKKLNLNFLEKNIRKQVNRLDGQIQKMSKKPIDSASYQVKMFELQQQKDKLSLRLECVSRVNTWRKNKSAPKPSEADFKLVELITDGHREARNQHAFNLFALSIGTAGIVLGVAVALNPALAPLGVLAASLCLLAVAAKVMHFVIVEEKYKDNFIVHSLAASHHKKQLYKSIEKQGLNVNDTINGKKIDRETKIKIQIAFNLAKLKYSDIEIGTFSENIMKLNWYERRKVLNGAVEKQTQIDAFIQNYGKDGKNIHEKLSKREAMPHVRAMLTDNLWRDCVTKPLGRLVEKAKNPFGLFGRSKPKVEEHSPKISPAMMSH